jgi:dTDP-4-dehydrorhamnose 3,5-epimerase
MTVTETPLPGVLLIALDRFGDARGSFFEAWNKERYARQGLPFTFVQDNVSYSEKGVLRGLHFQNPNPQGKLVHVVQGEVFDVAVDLRVGSPTFGKWFGAILSSANCTQMFIPEGFAHGFQALSNQAIFSYKCTGLYDKAGDRSLRWDDPSIGIEWPLKDCILSDKDRQAPLLKDLPREALFSVNPKG